MTSPDERLPESPGPADDVHTSKSTPEASPPASTTPPAVSAASSVIASLFICGGIFVSLVMAAFSQVLLEGCDEEHTCHYKAYHLGLFFAIGGPFIAPLIAGVLHTVATRRAQKAGEEPRVFDSGILWQIFGIQTLTIILAFILFSAVDPT